VLDQEYRTEDMRARATAREARYRQGGDPHTVDDPYAGEDKENYIPKKDGNVGPGFTAQTVKRDFFGRVIVNSQAAVAVSGRPRSSDGPEKKGVKKRDGKDEKKVWLHYHEGFSNAVRKPITMAELMAGL